MIAETINSELISSYQHNYAGIYLIRHIPSRMVYVGQSNNIQKRWASHKRQLLNGSHHNDNLKALSTHNNINNFDFEVIKKAPKFLSALQLQRWLIKEERKAYIFYKKLNKALNIVEPEIVPTNKAVKEYQKENEDRRNQHDKIISLKRKSIKLEINSLRSQLNPLEERLYTLKDKHNKCLEYIKKHTGWRRLFNSRPEDFNLIKEKEKIKELSFKKDNIHQSIESLRNNIYFLEMEYKNLYRQFSKIAAKRLDASYFRILGHTPSHTLISE